MYKTTKWIVATFCLAVLVFGCKVENVIQNNLTIDGFIFYATLMKSHKASEGKNNLVSFIESKKSEISYLYVEEFNTSLSKEVIQPPPVFESLNDFFKEDVLKKLTPTTEMSVGVVN